MAQSYVNMTKQEDGNLKIELLPEIWQALMFIEKFPEHDFDKTMDFDNAQELARMVETHTLLDVLEYERCNGWNTIRPEEIGALTSCDIILTDDISRDDENNIIELGNVWWYPEYETIDPLEELLDEGFLILTKVDADDNTDNE